MQRKKTLGYGIQTAAAQQLPDVSPPRSSPSSSPPSGIRLARPDVPRPGRSSVPPSLRSSVIPGAPANGNHVAPTLASPKLATPTLPSPKLASPPGGLGAGASTARAIAAIAAVIPPPPPSGLRPRSSAPPRPASVAKVAAPEPTELLLTDDEVTYVPDEEPAPRPPSRRPPPVAVPSLRSTGQNWPLVAPLTLAAPPRVPTFGPTPLPSMTPTLLALEADAVAAHAAAASPVTEQPAPSTPPVAPIPWVSLSPMPAPAPPADLGGTMEGPVERAIDPGMDVALVAPPTTTDLDLEEPIELPLSPAAVLRGRIVAAWQGASPNVRSALTFGAGIVVGALAVAIA